MGSHDIKQSLKMKRRQDRTRALQIPEEAEPGTLLALGSREMRSGNVNIAINFVHKVMYETACCTYKEPQDPGVGYQPHCVILHSTLLENKPFLPNATADRRLTKMSTARFAILNLLFL
jgi:hypothetical protein